MSLVSMCINVLARPEVVEIYRNQLGMIPTNLKTVLLRFLCKRGYIKDTFILQQLINPTVTVIDFSECEVTSDLLSCLHVCKYLQKLDLGLRRKQTRHISTHVLKQLFEHLHYLKVVAIPHCKEIDDEVIKIICYNCSALTELHIPNSSITDRSLYLIGKNLVNLTVINILGTTVCDLGIQLLLSGELSENLSEINIDKCPNLTPRSYRIIAKKCPNIKIFTCGKFGDDELGLAIDGIRTKAKQVSWSI